MFWIVSAVLESCFVLFQETTRIMVLCCIGSASKPYCRRAGFVDPVRCAPVRWLERAGSAAVFRFRGCWFMNLLVVAVDSYTIKIYASHPLME